MRVEILEERLRDMDAYAGVHHNLSRGDVVTVSDETGNAWCRRGWAKDLDGGVETGERVVKHDGEINPKKEGQGYVVPAAGSGEPITLGVHKATHVRPPKSKGRN